MQTGWRNVAEIHHRTTGFRRGGERETLYKSKPTV